MVGIVHLQGQGDNSKATGILILTQKISNQSPDIAFETIIKGRIPNLTPGEYKIQIHTKTIPENKCKTGQDDLIESQVSLS